MRILILSTPKTGNTWLTNLLAAIYDLPKLGLLCPFDRDQASKLGDRWIVFHHFPPEPELLDWITEAKPFLLTTVRHPGDVLLSLYHHVRGFSPLPVNLQEIRGMLHQPFTRYDMMPPACHTFREELECSLEWIRTGRTRIVRYEDLRQNTMGTLLDLCQWMGSKPPECIEQAIERCDIHLMRQLAGKHGSFFRSGEVGQWRQILSPEIIQDLQSPAYLAQFRELGYSLEIDGSSAVSAPATNINRNPFRVIQSFNNGVAVTPIMIDLYLSLDPSINQKWPPLQSTGPGSFFEWMNRTAECRGLGMYEGISIPNLAHFLYRVRSDLQVEFPNLFGRHRVSYCKWLIRNQHADFGASQLLMEPIKTSFWKWGIARHEHDRERRPWWPRLTNFVMHVYNTKPELQAAFPDIAKHDRWDYLQWIVREDTELETFPELIEPIRDDLRKTAKMRRPLEICQTNIKRIVQTLRRSITR